MTQRKTCPMSCGDNSNSAKRREKIWLLGRSLITIPTLLSKEESAEANNPKRKQNIIEKEVGCGLQNNLAELKPFECTWIKTASI